MTMHYGEGQQEAGQLSGNKYPAGRLSGIGAARLGDANRTMSAVEQSQAQLDEATNTLHKLISEMEQRLGPVLGPPPPGNDVGEASPTPRAVAAQIASSARMVHGAISRLQGLLSRLEV